MTRRSQANILIILMTVIAGGIVNFMFSMNTIFGLTLRNYLNTGVGLTMVRLRHYSKTGASHRTFRIFFACARRKKVEI